MGVGERDGKRVAMSAAERKRALVRALASACVLPGSSREYPVERMTGA